MGLMAVGLSVEFTAHFASSLNLSKGSLEHRLGLAMSHTFPALFEGSISTFCSIIPLAFAPEIFVLKYLFGIIGLVVVTGMVNGLVVMPALLALLAPLYSCPCCTKQSTQSDEAPKDGGLPTAP